MQNSAAISNDTTRVSEAAAVLVARSTARNLKGLPKHELCRLSRRFLEAFLAELHRNGQADPATLIQLSHLPLDLMLQVSGIHPEPPAEVVPALR